MATSFSQMLSPAGHFADPPETRYCAPYVLVTSIDLRPSHPDVEAFLYGPWERGTSKERAGFIPLAWRESFWALGIPVPSMAQPDDVVLVVALMEHVNGSPGAVRALVKKAIIEALDVSAGMAQETLVAKLIDKTNRTVDVANGGPNVTSAVGLLLQAEDMAHLDGNGSRTLIRSFSGYGGHYCLRLELSKTEIELQFAPENGEAFACAAK